ncbi:unnamed protein product [Phyllotreta striolata]|uniref:Uncharacterized protein n=1 Tax=Phyllotreta striolata TaxID=444603 RepID=A0A9N9TH60_PHYSR|nr:unnamed protein product [Phyllotreta striolata]
MTRRQIDDMSSNSSPSLDADHGMMSPPPPQASPAGRSPKEAPGSPTMLATMTPVNVMELKKEMEEESAMGRPPLYAQVKTEVLYEKDDDIYAQGIADKSDTPIDLIYEDGNKTVIYTTAPDQKGLEIYSADNTGEITINNISAHQIHGQQIADVLIDGNTNAMVNSSGETVGSPPGTVSVVLQGQLQYPQVQVPGTTVLVLSELVDDVGGVPVVGLRYVLLSFYQRPLSE